MMFLPWGLAPTPPPGDCISLEPPQLILAMSRLDGQSGELDPILFETVKAWLEASWPFSKVVYPGRV
ncbi:hypothetical protein ACFLXI_09230 [Chloroflexota bacterium]